MVSLPVGVVRVRPGGFSPIVGGTRRDGCYIVHAVPWCGGIFDGDYLKGAMRFGTLSPQSCGFQCQAMHYTRMDPSR